MKWYERRVRRSIVVLGACAALLAGVVLARFCLLHDARWFWLLVPLAVISLRRQTVSMACLVVLLCFGIGWWRGTQTLHQLATYDELYGANVKIRGRAAEEAVYGDRYQLVFAMDNLEVVSPHEAHLIGSIQVQGFGASAIFRGDRVLVEGKLAPTLGNNIARISFATITVEGNQSTVIDELRRRFAAGMESALPEPVASFGLGLLIGQRSTLPKDIADQLTHVGLTHIIAVSGYNLTIIVQIARKLFEKRSKYQATVISCSLIVVFLLITGLSPSIVRASVISMLGLLAWYYGRNLKPLVLLAVSAALTIAWNPLYLWGNVSWYLSFLAFFGVLIISPLVTKRLYKDREPNLLMSILIESVCASLMTEPYILYIFGQTSTVALLANVFVVPLIPLAMLLSLIAGLGGMFLPMISGWFALPAKWLLTYMLDMAHLLSKVPHAFLEHIGFSLAYLVVTYAFVLGLCVVLWHKTRTEKGAIITDKKAAAEKGNKAMSGHSKWSTIKREKGAKDAARGALFTKLGNAIAMAARSGTDAETNFALRLAIDKAKASNMPLSNIDRAIQRVNDKNAAVLQEILYEGYGPGGVAILVEVATDNINRTYPEVRLAFSKHGGNMAEKGAVAFQFDHKGMIRVKGGGDELLMQAIDAGAEDMQEEGEESVVYTQATDLAKVRDTLREQGVQISEAELTYVPNNTIEVTDAETAGKIMRLMDALDECDDVTNTHVNFDIPEELL